ncbi:hypothetical protein GQX73_g6957 [Xylaria multiplex]|uniref:Uncharacterized protein n=1 Tax=Xylaria multiplex TaxID=323545 RepID=A0A7C8MNK2_9PEZI|nr:hypothetical protein GQX73_g6957 [Xylaria multiplex]
MQLKTIVATALLPLLAVADDTSTLTSTMTMTKYVTISKVATSSVYANVTTSIHQPIGTGYSTFPTTTAAEQGSGSPTGSSPTVSPTIDNGGSSGAGTLSAFGFAGVAGMVLAALM